MKILVVDDEALLVKGIRFNLQNEGYEVVTGSNGAEAVDYLKKKVKNAIIVDAEELCREFGSSKFFNIAILGVACGANKLGLSREQILGEIEKRVPKKYLEQNIAAFQKGEQIGESYAAE